MQRPTLIPVRRGRLLQEAAENRRESRHRTILPRSEARIRRSDCGSRQRSGMSLESGLGLAHGLRPIAASEWRDHLSEVSTPPSPSPRADAACYPS